MSQRSVRVRRTSALAILILSLALVTCGDDDSKANTETLAFPPDRADALIHAALPRAEELPGSNWEVAGRDQFTDNATNDGESRKLLEAEPSCKALMDVPGFDEANETPRSARAQIKFKRPGRGLVPGSSQIEVQLTVAETAEEVRRGWETSKPLFESGDWQRCVGTLAQQRASTDSRAGMPQVELSIREASTTTPQEGAAVAFDFVVQVAALKLNVSTEMYLWAHSNATITVIFSGGRGDFTEDEMVTTLRTVNEAVRAAEERAAEAQPKVALLVD